MATDPQSLLSQANCYACYGIWGTWKILEVALFAQWAAAVGTGGNLIPPGAVYSNGTYIISAIPGHSYQWTKGANDVSINDNLNNECTSNCTIVAETLELILGGISGTNVPVTATLVRLN